MTEGGKAPEKRSENGDAPKRTRRRPGTFGPGNTAAKGKGRPRRDAFLDQFMEAEVPGGEGQSPIERRHAYLMRLYTSAMDPRRKDHAKLMEMLGTMYWGKARERLELSGPAGGAIKTEDSTPRRATTGEMRKRLDELLAKRAAYLATKEHANGESNGATNGHAVNGHTEEP